MSECFRIDRGETDVYVPLVFQFIYGCSAENGKNGDGEAGRKSAD